MIKQRKDQERELVGVEMVRLCKFWSSNLINKKTLFCNTYLPNSKKNNYNELGNYRGEIIASGNLFESTRNYYKFCILEFPSVQKASYLSVIGTYIL